MGGQSHTPVTVDPQTVAESKKLWEDFIRLSRYTAMGVVAILILMAIFVA